MKKLFCFFALSLCLSAGVFAQSSYNDENVVTIDKANKRAFRENEIIVKFNPDGPVKVKALRGHFVSTAVSSVDEVMKKIGVQDVEELMPLTGNQSGPAYSRGYNGQSVKRDKLNKLYLLRLDGTNNSNIFDAIEQLQKVEDVEFAEPNYLVYTLVEDEGETVTPDDPLYSQQWGLPAINMPQLWAQDVAGTQRPVIAILDTGVDTEHPDLAANIWTNTAEAEGEEDADDDANGFKDDIHGWDFVNQSANVRDFNGHGTHVAGIAAAVGNNGVGVIGANPDALIMPITVMQSDGTGDVATIIKGIDYAVANGADVINMSFGGYAYSVAEERALGNAYSQAVLVAAAGNDCLPINDTECDFCKKIGAPMFPAAFTFVLGVEATDASGQKASFSNYDDDGPFYSAYNEEQLYNYELKAPGTNILSTFPKGVYKALNGTSMAAPMVAGAVSRLIQTKEYTSKELLFGDLMHRTTSGVLDIYSAWSVTDADRQPTLHIVGLTMDDSAGDNDGRYDAGETISLYPVLRNEWGQATNVVLSLEMGELEDESLITFIDNNVALGTDLSSYAKATASQPIRFTISNSCVDGRHIRLKLIATCDNAASVCEQEFVISVDNGVELSGIIDENLTLTSDKHYIVTGNLAVADGATLTLTAGTKLIFKPSSNFLVSSGAHFDSQGTMENPVVFTGKDSKAYKGSIIFTCEDEVENVIFEDFDCIAIESGSFKNCIFQNNIFYNYGFFAVGRSILLNNCIIRYNSLSPTAGGHYLFWNNTGKMELSKCNIYGQDDISMEFNDRGNTHNTHIETTNYCNNRSNSDAKIVSLWVNNLIPERCNIFSNYDKNGAVVNAYSNSDKVVIYSTSSPCYFGTAYESIVREGVFDIHNGSGYGEIDISNMLTRPTPDAHGIVWKVVVDGYDAQDEFDQLPPLGVGRHEFKVYYSRAINTAIAPTISMGVRTPYTQTAIAEDGVWSVDDNGDYIYTAYLTITGKSNCDGLNRIYVRGGKDDEGFDIPDESTRFNVMVQAAGSMSTGLAAEAGLGKVTLTWVSTEESFADMLGYNVYRVTENATDTLKINETLLGTDVTTFEDYDVVPGTTYYYLVREMGTDLKQNDVSNIVACTPLTADKGDANGSMSVDVADVLTEVNYITGQNPQPFIFEAADVNEDTKVDILDVIGTVRIITTPAEAQTEALNNDAAIYTVEDGVLYVETPVTLGGVQVLLDGQATDIEVLEALNGFEKVTARMNADSQLFLAYSMSGKTLAPGRHALLRLNDAEVTDMVLSDNRGHNVLTENGNITALTFGAAEGKEETVIRDLMGRTVSRCTEGGIYVVSKYIDGQLMQTKKILVK